MNNTTTNTKREAAIAAIIEYFNDNEYVFNDCVEQLDSYNGYLGDDRYYNMDELDEICSGVEASEILRRAFYGHDEESWTTDSSGNREYGEFNPNRDYFRFNGYGNLVSADYKDYSGHLDGYVVEDMADNRMRVYAIDEDNELSALFDALEEAENGEEG